MEEGHKALSINAMAGSDGLHVTVAGELDLATADQLHQAVPEILGRAGDPIILDLARVTFSDSEGIAALLQLQRRQIDAGQPIQLVNTTGTIQSLLYYSGLLHCLNITRASPPHP
jgi:anti-anti-sigma factor